MFFDFGFQKNHNGQVKELTTAAHITKGVIGVFFRKNVIRFGCCCFQNVSF